MSRLAYPSDLNDDRRWVKTGLWERLNAHPPALVRLTAGRDEQPSQTIIDSQSVKTVEKRGLEQGCGQK